MIQYESIFLFRGKKFFCWTALIHTHKMTSKAHYKNLFSILFVQCNFFNYYSNMLSSY